MLNSKFKLFYLIGLVLCFLSIGNAQVAGTNNGGIEFQAGAAIKDNIAINGGSLILQSLASTIDVSRFKGTDNNHNVFGDNTTATVGPTATISVGAVSIPVGYSIKYSFFVDSQNRIILKYETTGPVGSGTAESNVVTGLTSVIFQEPGTGGGLTNSGVGLGATIGQGNGSGGWKTFQFWNEYGYNASDGSYHVVANLVTVTVWVPATGDIGNQNQA